MQTHVDERQKVREPGEWWPHRRHALIIAGVVLACLMACAVVADLEWPFTKESITKSLEQQSGAAVQIVHFRRFYFPHPGCVAEQLVFRQGNKAVQPLITIQKLTIVGSYHGLLTRHVSTIRVEGLHIFIAREPGSNGYVPVNLGSSNSGITIGQMIADGAQVEFASTRQRPQPMIFSVPKLMLHDIADHKPLAYRALVEIPQPPATVEVVGEFGPWRAGQGGRSRMSGAYTVKNLDLGSIYGIQGMMTASGSFDGTLEQVKVQGTADVPRFIVEQSGHPQHVETRYVATVNGLDGDVNVNAGWGHFGNTTVVGAGTVAGEGLNKTATLEFASNQARIEDLLWMLVSDRQPAMTGALVFRGKATIPPGLQGFLKKVKVQGDFGVSDGQYPNPQTQRDIDVLSAQARGKAAKVERADNEYGGTYDPGRVLSHLKGHVMASDGVAHLSDVSFDVPGASAWVHGTYNLESFRINLSGHMHMQASLSQATTGVKSFLMKVIKPFLHKSKRNESVVAITVGGTWDTPTYTATPKAAK